MFLKCKNIDCVHEKGVKRLEVVDFSVWLPVFLPEPHKFKLAYASTEGIVYCLPQPFMCGEDEYPFDPCQESVSVID